MGDSGDVTVRDPPLSVLTQGDNLQEGRDATLPPHFRFISEHGA